MMNIKLMADYQCHPLWDISPERYGDIDPSNLPISPALRLRLAQWARMYDETLNMNDPASSGFHDAHAEADFKSEGHRLANQLRNELGPEFTVTVQV